MTLRRLLIAIALVVVVFLAANAFVFTQARGHVFSRVGDVPAHHVALVLGTSKWIGNRPNLYFEHRMDAAAALYHAGKARYLLLSGDHGNKDYNEPEDMKSALIARGVPAEKLVLDFAGFRTLDSVARAQAVFGQRKVLIVSQEFHNHRAVYLARRHGLEASAFNAQAVDNYYGFKTHMREWFARAAAVADTLVLARKPRFYGPRVEIPAA